MNNKNLIKGHNYEVQVKQHIINNLYKIAYIWYEAPERILLKNNIIGSHNQNRIRRIEFKENSLQDTGVDIIQMEENDICSLVQCKNGYKKGLTMKDLAGFFGWLFSLNELKGYVYYTDKLSHNLKSLPNNSRIEYIKLQYINDNENNEKERINNKIIYDNYSMIPYNYQLEAKNAFNENFNKRGIISMPCGTGKTYTSYLISEQYKQIVILSPLRQFAKQNLEKYIEYGYKNKTLLVDSDGTRNSAEIKKFIESNELFIISSTYCSVDMIYENLQYMNNPFFIIDEFHNLSKRNVTDKNDDFYKLLNSNVKIMFMSATPRIYDFENNSNEDIVKEIDKEEDDDDELDEENTIENDDDYDESLFGPTIYNMTFNEAIHNKYITDYRIWLPSIHENNDKLNEELSIYKIDLKMNAKCNFLFSSLLNNGSRKCIIYNTDSNEIQEMIDAIYKLNNFYCLDIEINVITCTNNAKSREEILKKFEKNNNKIQLLFSIRILDECIDIPSCDSIFITYPCKNKIRLIQRLCRCIRIDKNNKSKIGNIYIWCNEYDEITDTLSGIKEYDIEFKDKIRVNEINFYGESNKVEFNNDVKLLDNYIVGIKEFRCLSWEEKLKGIEDYIIANGELPVKRNKNKDIKVLSYFLGTQKQNYKKNKGIMKNNEIKIKWEEFIEKYKSYFLSYEEIWLKYLNQVIEYIILNEKLPIFSNSDKNIKKLNRFIRTQKENYKNNKNIMKNERIKKIWEDFINKYKIYFLSNEEIWINKINEIQLYIEEHNKLPCQADKNEKIKKMGYFITLQKINYTSHDDIMKNENIRIIWEQFIEKYEELFLSRINIWTNNFNNLEQYIITNGKLPSEKNEDKYIRKLGQFLGNQKKNFKDKIQIMKNEDIYNKWNNFIDKYQELFISDEEIWFYNISKIEEYIVTNNKFPTRPNKDKNIEKLAKFLSHQKENYKQNVKNMKNNDKIRNAWINFIEKHKEHFFSPNELWEYKLNMIIDYIKQNKKVPSCYDKDSSIKSLGRFIKTQNQNYKNGKYIMKDQEIRLKWNIFLEEYKEYFR